MRVLMGDNRAPAPPELSELRLCRDIYHCTPVELAKVPYDVIQRHWAVMEAERQVNNLQSGGYDLKRPVKPKASKRGN